ncbi:MULTISPECIES: protoporphyrinogen oxidase [Heyndrickxia]|uniref:protoporphyrinogen oxidase n=1 Tax=Heyndrickxia TaxID=2837504 RepID=UPI002E2171A0|nr:protoporphyrinogen oxidase [Heyndrickxia sporothermodurans]MED3697161.1 protoporphyrinogen oxidase [Heyndrickxia sporothermodurans]MED3781679.1 protoporphyrinogen oxidase [Heyndrickxia sporothermodurans]
MKTVVVIGGGITGLSTLYYLQQLKETANIELNLKLIEGNDELGGKIHSVQTDEFIMETGADSIVARKQGVAELLENLHLHNEMVNNATGKSFIYHHGQLKPIPDDTVFGIPMSKEALLSSELISEAGKNEALKDFTTTNESFTKDSSIGQFLEHFLGKEIVENQIAPVLSGVYSGKLNELTLATTLPYLLDYKNQYGSIMKGLSENKERFQSADNKKFVSFKNGLSTLIDRLEIELTNVEILKGIKATSIIHTQDGYTVTLENGTTIHADYIVLSTPHQVAQSLLQNEVLDEDFNQLVSSSLISVYLGFDVPDEKLPADGTGFIVPDNSDLVCNACTWTSRKWTHTSKNNHLLLRLFYKNTNPTTFEHLNSLNERELIQVALKDIEKSLGITGEPKHSEVTKWTDLMPKYSLSHRKTIESLNKKIDDLYPNITLAGCSYYGVGIADCIMNGKETANQLIEQISNNN